MGGGMDILMYHSISEGPGPTCIPPATFQRQMAVMAECGYRGISLAEFASSAKVGRWPDEKVVVLTFDDGFEDFATTAYPELEGRDWSATVFLPAAKVGATADWDRRRPLMSWDTVRDLAARGVEFGAHGLTHADLTRQPFSAARQEIIDSGRLIADRVGRPVVSFAAPFGGTTATIREEIRRHYESAVGTRLDRASPASDLHDLPRLEMWYFRDPHRWESFLRGGSRAYFLLRRLLRWGRAVVRTKGAE